MTSPKFSRDISSIISGLIDFDVIGAREVRNGELTVVVESA